MTLPLWEDRPIELANLLNPAFCALLLRETINGYTSTSHEALPYILSYLVLPIVLYTPCREELPKTIRTSLHSWLQENVALQYQVTKRIPRLVPYSQEAILFGIQHNWIRINSDGNMILGNGSMQNIFPEGTEPAECVKAARMIGRWFGNIADPVMILTFWGLRP
jgi:hypothetical protein